MRDWFWELRKRGQGPDYFLISHFAASNAAQILEKLRQNPPPQFSRVSDEASYKIYRRQNRSHYELFRYDRNSEFYGSLIEIGNGLLCVERSFSGLQDASARIELEYSLELMNCADLTFDFWEIQWGGQGYSGGTMAIGVSVEFLMDYLK